MGLEIVKIEKWLKQSILDLIFNPILVPIALFSSLSRRSLGTIQDI